MILGTCNFGREYNGKHVEIDEAIEMINVFGEFGGKVLDTGLNYGNAHKVIKLSGWTGKVQTKAWNIEDVDRCLDDFDGEVYAILSRNSADHRLTEYLIELQACGVIEKYGISIYFPHEIIQRANIIQFPCNDIFVPYLPIMSLYAQVQARSVFNSYLPGGEWSGAEKIKRYCDFVIGCDSVDQVKDNMWIFGKK
jgi:hypothetical protein